MRGWNDCCPTTRAPSLWYLRIIDDTLTLRDGASSVLNSTDRDFSTGLQVDRRETIQSPREHFKSADYRNFFWAFAAIAGAILVGISIRVWAPSSVSLAAQGANVDFARIVEVSNVKWADGAAKYDEWSSIQPGDRLQLTSGWVNVFFSNGAELLIEGPADVRYDSSQKVFARQGKAGRPDRARCGGFPYRNAACQRDRPRHRIRHLRRRR